MLQTAMCRQTEMLTGLFNKQIEWLDTDITVARAMSELVERLADDAKQAVTEEAADRRKDIE